MLGYGVCMVWEVVSMLGEGVCVLEKWVCMGNLICMLGKGVCTGKVIRMLGTGVCRGKVICMLGYEVCRLWEGASMLNSHISIKLIGSAILSEDFILLPWVILNRNNSQVGFLHVNDQTTS